MYWWLALQTPRARALAKLLLLSTGGQLSLSITVHPVDSYSEGCRYVGS